MLKRLRQAVVESYIGAVALGHLLAQVVLQFISIFASPVAGWASRTDLREAMRGAPVSTGISFRDGLPYLIRFVGLSAVWWILVRWLYYNPRQPKEKPG